ncbi:MAG: Fic family protein [Candidatus Obscuribacterales bacterium]|nr:Fic family protein [Candidatus Obscuribacterales bacterium]
MSTESEIKDWRYGSTQAERMCAQILVLEKYEDVDPQAPLGGPDGIKDLKCAKSGSTFIAACFFASTPKSFREVKKKFKVDLLGVAKEKVDGMVFFVNQPLTLTERKDLQETATAQKAVLVLYHLERIRTVLDSPSGYGLRAQYLRIPTTTEENLSLMTILSEQHQSQKQIIDRLTRELYRTQSMILQFTPLPTSPSTTSAMLLYPNEVSANLTLPLITTIHRALLQNKFDGLLRQVNVWIGHAGSNPGNSVFVPEAWENIPTKLAELLAGWNSNYPMFKQSQSRLAIVRAVASFHYRFLEIHPFIDGNGRAANFLMQQQVRDLLASSSRVDDLTGGEYYAALLSCNAGNLNPLEQLVDNAIKCAART